MSDGTVLRQYGHARYTRDMHRMLLAEAARAPSIGWPRDPKGICGPLSVGSRAWAIEQFAESLRDGHIDAARMIETLEHLVLVASVENARLLSQARTIDELIRSNERLRAELEEAREKLERLDPTPVVEPAYTGPRPTAWEHLLGGE